MTPEPGYVDLSNLSVVELAVAIRNLRLLLDMHIDERFRRVEEKEVRPQN
jgi:hypothetical protein